LINYQNKTSILVKKKIILKIFMELNISFVFIILLLLLMRL